MPDEHPSTAVVVDFCAVQRERSQREFEAMLRAHGGYNEPSPPYVVGDPASCVFSLRTNAPATSDE